MSAAATPRSAERPSAPPAPGAERATAPAPAPATRLDARLTSLVAGHAPLRRAQARIAARLVATRGWERLGFARLRD